MKGKVFINGKEIGKLQSFNLETNNNLKEINCRILKKTKREATLTIILKQTLKERIINFFRKLK